MIDLGIDVNAGDKRDNRAPICSAAANNHRAIVECLLMHGAVMDVSSALRNPLFAAIIGRAPEIVSLLLINGINVGVRYNSSSMKDMDALAFALMRGELECANIIANWSATGDDALCKTLMDQTDQVAIRNSY